MYKFNANIMLILLVFTTLAHACSSPEKLIPSRPQCKVESIKIARLRSMFPKWKISKDLKTKYGVLQPEIANSGCCFEYATAGCTFQGLYGPKVQSHAIICYICNYRAVFEHIILTRSAKQSCNLLGICEKGQKNFFAVSDQLKREIQQTYDDSNGIYTTCTDCRTQEFVAPKLIRKVDAMKCELPTSVEQKTDAEDEVCDV